MPKLSTKKIAANNRWNAKAYDQIVVRVKKGQKDIITDIAKSKGLSLNGYINQAITNQLEADQAVEPSPVPDGSEEPDALDHVPGPDA